MGELAAWHVSYIVAAMPFVNKVLNPQTINPYRETDNAAVQRARGRANAIHFAVLAGKFED